MLAKGTALMGPPRRITDPKPKYGVIADHLVNNRNTQHPPSSIYSPPHSENAATIPRAHPAFEIRTSSSALPPDLAELYDASVASFVQSLDSDDVSDENEPPSYSFKEETPYANGGTGIHIPETRLRVLATTRKREPFAVLHLAAGHAGVESKQNIKPIWRMDDGIWGYEKEKNESSPPHNNTTEDGTRKVLKGMIRLRAKAPPPIDMKPIHEALQLDRQHAFNATDSDTDSEFGTVESGSSLEESTADSKIESVELVEHSNNLNNDNNNNIHSKLDLESRVLWTNAPTMPMSMSRLGVKALPAVMAPGSRTRMILGSNTSRFLRVGSNVPAELLALVVPESPSINLKKVPMTPGRQSLLDILDGKRSTGLDTE
jgi:hypothetical protein